MTRQLASSGRLWAFLTSVVAMTASGFADGPAVPSPYWKNQITFPNDPFVVAGTGTGEAGWAKFTILTDPYDPNIVYFQDGHQYELHYDFGTEYLEPLLGMTSVEYYYATRYVQGREAILGAVITPPTGGFPPPSADPEYGIQFVGQDPFTKEEIVELFSIVRSNITAGPEVQAFYFPSYEQKASAEANRDWLEAAGVPVSCSDRWAGGNVCYSQGWALGELKYVEGHYIDTAYFSGYLKPEDVLLTDGVPAEVPYLAGIITLSPSTPNSHVAILAQNSSIPFAHLAIPEDANRAMELDGHTIVLRAYDQYGTKDIRLIDVEGVLDAPTIEEILALKRPPPLDISPIAHYGGYSASTEDLLPEDIQYFGGKAANFAILRKAIPDNAPVAVALSFDLWTQFLQQPMLGGRTLQEEIDARLAPYIEPPINPSALSIILTSIRDLFRSQSITRFTPSQQQAILDVLQNPQYGFDPHKKIRFRSSTNMEDSDQFTGAGLYDSYSGCLADDLDGDRQGPCRCDAEESNERSVFRAIRKVFASFYNDNAFLERLRYDVNEHEVGMAVLVHHSFPDEIELANGVAVVEKINSSSWNITLVTQKGATSVTNPSDGSIPEQVDVPRYSFGTYPTLVRQSNLVPLGATVLDWQNDYLEMSDLLIDIGNQFAKTSGKSKYVLEMEYKKVAPQGKLIVKQVRQIPQPDQVPSIVPYLVSTPVDYCTFQGEYGDVFGNHRLKSRWVFETNNCWLSRKSLTESLYHAVNLEYVAEGRIRILAGRPSLWPMASHSYEDNTTVDSWQMHHLSNQRSCTLRTSDIPSLVSRAQSPILTLSDLGNITLEVAYKDPVPTRDWSGSGMTRADSVRLCQRPEEQIGDLLQRRQCSVTIGRDMVSFDIQFYWPHPPTGAVAGYTAPLIRWAETVIRGYTSEPIILHGWYSQTYRPGHHNFTEHFLFEPQLENGISADILDELKAKNIRMIYLFLGFGEPEIMTYGYDDEPFVAGDIDRDDDVDQADFALLAEQWLKDICDTCGGADLTGDGTVNSVDLQELTRQWLTTIR